MVVSFGATMHFAANRIDVMQDHPIVVPPILLRPEEARFEPGRIPVHSSLSTMAVGVWTYLLHPHHPLRE